MIEASRKIIRLDPDIIIEARLELAKKYLIDEKTMLEKDHIQSSETPTGRGDWKRRSPISLRIR
jgi:hypothetical protein